MAPQRLPSPNADEPEGDGGQPGIEYIDRALLPPRLEDAQISAIEASEDVVMAQVARGRNPGPAASMLKIQGTETAQQVQQLAVELSGDYAAVSQFAARQPGSNEAAIGPDIALTAMPRYFNGRAASIYGGSNEIQRHINPKKGPGG